MAFDDDFLCIFSIFLRKVSFFMLSRKKAAYPLSTFALVNDKEVFETMKYKGKCRNTEILRNIFR